MQYSEVPLATIVCCHYGTTQNQSPGIDWNKLVLMVWFFNCCLFAAPGEKKNLNSLLKRLEIEQVKCARKFFWKEKIDAFLQCIMYFSEITPSPASLKVCRDFARANLLKQLIK